MRPSHLCYHFWTMRLAVPLFVCAFLLGAAAACDEQGGQLPSTSPDNAGGTWTVGSGGTGGTASGGVPSEDGSGGLIMAGGPAVDDGVDPVGPEPFRCDAVAFTPNPWLEPNTDLSRRAIFKPTGAQCGPGVEVDVWDGYFNEIFVDCRDWPFPWPSQEAEQPLRDFAVRSLVLKEPLTPGVPWAVSTDVVSPTPTRVELWGTCAACGDALEYLGAQDIDAVPAGVVVCFEINASAPHSHLLLLMSDVNAAHGHIRFCAGQTCPTAPAR